MKQDRITVLYKGLDHTQQAALAFSYLATGNELEFERVLSAVPMKKYSGPEAEYQERFDGMARMTLLWAIEHWRAHANKFAALAGRLAVRRCGDQDEADAMLTAHEKAEARLLALDVALEVACGEIGVEADAVRRVAGAAPFVPMLQSVQPDPDYLTQMQAALTRLVSD